MENIDDMLEIHQIRQYFPHQNFCCMATGKLKEQEFTVTE